MNDVGKTCLHLEGLRISAGSVYRCPLCGVMLDAGGVARWVREAEVARDGAYSTVEGDRFHEIVHEEMQREVYRRRRVMYELGNVPRTATVRPEMVLVVHNAGAEVYDCRIFYKERRSSGLPERVSVGATTEAILEARSDADPVVRLISEKLEEFHGSRLKLSGDGEPAPERRVFYANEL